jgi:hypothetical protein
MAWLIGIQNSENLGLMPKESRDSSYSSIMVAVSEPVTNAREKSGHVFFQSAGMLILRLTPTLTSLNSAQIVKR